MKNKFIMFLSLCALLFISGCATTSVAGNGKEREVNSVVVFDCGKVTLEKIDSGTLTEAELGKKGVLTEEITGLRLEILDGALYFEGIDVTGFPLSKFKELMGEDKFSAFWTAYVDVMGSGKTKDERLLKVTFENGDYIILDMKQNINDMKIDVVHDPSELANVQILVPITFKIKN